MVVTNFAWIEASNAVGNGSSSGVCMGTFKMKMSGLITNVIIRGVSVHSDSYKSVYIHLKNVTKGTYHVSQTTSNFPTGGNSPARTGLQTTFNLGTGSMNVSTGDVIVYCFSNYQNNATNIKGGFTSGAYNPFWDSKATVAEFQGIQNYNTANANSPKYILDLARNDGSYSHTKNNTHNIALVVGSLNTAPTAPSTFTKQPAANSVNLSKEIVELSWSASTDKENNAIHYQLEFYNGSTWSVVASNITGTTYKHTLPSENIASAQYRVRAVDSEGATSGYLTSNVFKVYRYLVLMQDGAKNKTFKNGVWSVI